jgi:hypothetical protein
VAAVGLALGLVLSRSDGGPGNSGEVFLQAAAKTGPDPFTPSTATGGSAAPISAAPTGTSTPANALRGVDGAAPGLYGGTRNTSSCDVERQIRALGAEPAKNAAFASVAGVAPTGVPSYLRSLTPVQLRMDTRVTNHGYRDGAATRYQAVLQTGTAVLVDDRGVPRVRCACGNPLTPPVAQPGTPRQTGDSWPGFRPSEVVVVAPAERAVRSFVLYDPDHRQWFARRPGDTGRHDRRTAPPARLPSSSATTGPASPSCPSGKPCPPDSASSAPASPPSSSGSAPGTPRTTVVPSPGESLAPPPSPAPSTPSPSSSGTPEPSSPAGPESSSSLSAPPADSSSEASSGAPGTVSPVQ